MEKLRNTIYVNLPCCMDVRKLSLREGRFRPNVAEAGLNSDPCLIELSS